ncbi:hypothetical protein BD560DRAFT_423807 [Blakeslea trispora]|nr:hypothetical protein BD560DRAFT_423807 [Blakeslea trispora]
MAYRFEKYASKSFCPLILYHDSPSKQLSIQLNENKEHNRTAIDRHRERISEMLEHNAQFWTLKTVVETGMFDCNTKSSRRLTTCSKDDLKDIKVSPSTSTTSNISSSSSSSGDSIATIEHSPYQPSRMNVPSPIHAYRTIRGEDEDDEEEIEIQHKSEKTNNSLKKHQTRSTKTSTSSLSTDSTKKRRRGNLPKEVTEFLRKWLIQHKKHPYPAEKEKADLARHTGLTVNQISNWFINARRRILQPMLESENMTAQMMSYPELMYPNQQPTYEPSRRRRHDFYTYQRDFAHKSCK